MRLGWLVFLLGGCTALNPLFGDEGDAAGTGSAGSTSGKTTDDSGGEVGTSTSASTSTAQSSDTGLFTTAASSDSGGSCSLPEVIDVAIDVTPPAAADPTCASVWMSPQGPLSVDGGEIIVADCGCPCADELVPAATATIAGIDVPPLPDCGFLMAWQVPADGVCEWAGVAVFTSSAPEWIVSRTPFVPPSVFGGLEVALDRTDACASTVCDAAGVYRLEFTDARGDNRITMDDAPKPMRLPFNAQLQYLVDDVSSVIDEQCVSHLAWTAGRDI